MAQLNDEILVRNIEAERAGLAYLEVGGRWQGDLATDDFSLEIHRTIFYAMDALNAEQQEINRSSLAAELMKRGKLEGIGGLNYLVDLDTSTGIDRNSNVRPYVELLHELRDKRRIQYHNQRVTCQLKDRTVDESKRLMIHRRAGAGAVVEAQISQLKPEPGRSLVSSCGEAVRSAG